MDCRSRFCGNLYSFDGEILFSNQGRGRLYNPYKVSDNPWAEIRAACKKFNESDFWCDSNPLEELKKHFARAGEDMVLTPPFYCDQGDKIYFGKHFYANTGLTILDENKVVFGNERIVICKKRNHAAVDTSQIMLTDIVTIDITTNTG